MSVVVGKGGLRYLSLEWCECGHIRWWHDAGICLSCSKAWNAKQAMSLGTAVMCKFRERLTDGSAR